MWHWTAALVCFFYLETNCVYFLAVLRNFEHLCVCWSQYLLWTHWPMQQCVIIEFCWTENQPDCTVSSLNLIMRFSHGSKQQSALYVYIYMCVCACIEINRYIFFFYICTCILHQRSIPGADDDNSDQRDDADSAHQRASDQGELLSQLWLVLV